MGETAASGTGRPEVIKVISRNGLSQTVVPAAVRLRWIIPSTTHQKLVGPDDERVAVDLGASSGRVMLARYERECRSLTLREIHRFNNGLHSQNGYVTWNVDRLESAIRLGLNKVCEEGIRIDSIGIDT